MKFFITVFFLSLSVFARQTDDQVNFKIEKAEIAVSPKAGYHLNAEAPATATFDNSETAVKPQPKTEKLMSFKHEEKNKTATLKFYVCDDKKTVCEQHEQKINLMNGEAKSAATKPVFNNIQDVKLTSADGKPTLLVFSAPWCPACVRMMTETYHKPLVEKQLAKLNFVKLNSDLAENYELFEKFKIKAIPTLILLDKNGNETYRWLDYQPAQSFAKSVEMELKKVDQSASQLDRAKLGDTVAASELGHRAFNSMDFAEALKWFSLTKSENDQKYKLSSEVSFAQDLAGDDEKQIDGYLQSLQKAIVLTTSKLDRIRWTLDYFDKKNELKSFSEEAKVKAKALVSEIDGLAKNQKVAAKAFKESTYGDYDGFEKIELLWMKAKAQDILQMSAEEKATKTQSVSEIKKIKLSVDRPGEMLMAIGYLKEAGETVLTESLYNKLIAKYPNSYVYFEKYARFSQKNKNLPQALTLTEEALKYPEGNEPQLMLLKSQILKDLNKKEDAVKTLDSALSAEYISHKRYAKIVKKMTDLRKELASAN